VNPLLAPAFKKWRTGDGSNAQVWVVDGCLDEIGELTLDTLLGVSLPKDYDPRNVIEVTASSRDGSPVPFGRWFEITPAGTDMMSNNRNAQGACSYSSTTTHCASPSEARELVKRKAATAGITVRLAQEVEGAPQPAEGGERWIVVP
jgi:hypothetical protein